MKTRIIFMIGTLGLGPGPGGLGPGPGELGLGPGGLGPSGWMDHP